MLHRILYPHFIKPAAIFFTAVLAAFAFSSCSSESPTKPTQDPVAIGGTPNSTFSVTVTASPATALANGQDRITINVTVRNSSTGAVPPDGASAILSTSVGEWIVSTGETGLTSIAVGLVNGRASAQLFAPAGTDGSGSVSAEFSGVFGSVGIRFGDATFFVNSIDPNTGDPDGGETVRIRGGGFESPVTVTFGSVSAAVQSVTNGIVRVTSPPQVLAAGATSLTVSVTVTNVGGQSGTLQNAFTYTRLGDGDTPRIFSIDPTSGPNEGGTIVTLRGDGFEQPLSVFFGGGTGALVEGNVLSVTATEIRVESPPATGLGSGNADSTVDVTVRNIGTGREGVLPASFTYGPKLNVTAVQPAQGSGGGGDTVTIFGSGFVEPLFVDIAGVRATVVSVTDSEIVVTTGAAPSTGCADVTGEVIVTNSSTGISNTGGPSYTYLVSQGGPVFTGVTPTSGTSNGGTSVSLSGTFGGNQVRVFFEDASQSIQGQVNSQSGSSISVRTPAWPVSSLQVNSCDDNMDMVFGEKYIDTPVTVRVEDTGNGCTASIANVYTYRPANTGCRGD